MTRERRCWNGIGALRRSAGEGDRRIPTAGAPSSRRADGDYVAKSLPTTDPCPRVRRRGDRYGATPDAIQGTRRAGVPSTPIGGDLPRLDRAGAQPSLSSAQPGDRHSAKASCRRDLRHSRPRARRSSSDSTMASESLSPRSSRVAQRIRRAKARGPKSSYWSSEDRCPRLRKLSSSDPSRSHRLVRLGSSESRVRGLDLVGGRQSLCQGRSLSSRALRAIRAIRAAPKIDGLGFALGSQPPGAASRLREPPARVTNVGNAEQGITASQRRRKRRGRTASAPRRMAEGENGSAETKDFRSSRSRCCDHHHGPFHQP